MSIAASNSADIEAIAVRVAELLAEETPRPASPWLTVPEVAAYAAMSIDGVRAAEKRGQLKAHRSTTGRVRFLRSDVDAFLEGST